MPIKGHPVEGCSFFMPKMFRFVTEKLLAKNPHCIILNTQNVYYTMKGTA